MNPFDQRTMQCRFDDATKSLPEWQVQRAKELLQSDYNPWTFENFTEAVENAELGARKSLFWFVAEAAQHDGDRNNENQLVVLSARNLIADYWVRCAIKQAEKEGEDHEAIALEAADSVRDRRVDDLATRRAA